jgi:CubicO group peptidase (beta-lactamase class C family)
VTFDDLEPLIERVMAEWKVPGIAIAVVHNDEPVLVNAFGQRDIEAGLAVTTDTQFLLCSVTKSFTATGLAMLADERRLDWRKPVREYLPEFRLHDPIASDRVTVQDLLCHQTGLPRHDWIWMPGDLSPEQMLAAMRHLEPNRDIRQSYQYQNLGYLAAGVIAERITGQTWQAFTRDRILSPLAMLNFSFSAEELEQAPDSARPYSMNDDERHRAALYPIGTAPAGGLSTTISDTANYVCFHLGGGAFNDVRLLSQQSARMMQTLLVYAGRSEFAEIGEQHYGLGLARYTYRGERAVSHDGGWIGWGTRMDMLPDRKVGVVVLTNRALSPVTTILCHAVFDRVSGQDPAPWFDRFAQRRRDFLAQQGSRRYAQEVACRPDTRPSHEMTEYAGTYEHPGCGLIAIDAKGDMLHWRYRGLAGLLNHRHYDVFEVPETPNALAPDLLSIAFSYDRDGNIDRLSAPFEPLVSDIVFRRMPAGEALDPAFRVRCEGTDRVGAKCHVVALEPDGELTLSPSDQPTYGLAPCQGRPFAIVGLEGFRVEFQHGETGLMEAIIFHQPNGTFRAQRITDGSKRQDGDVVWRPTCCIVSYVRADHRASRVTAMAPWPSILALNNGARAHRCGRAAEQLLV